MDEKLSDTREIDIHLLGSDIVMLSAPGRKNTGEKRCRPLHRERTICINLYGIQEEGHPKIHLGR